MNKENWYYVDEEAWKKEFSAKINKLLYDKDVSINKVASDINVDPKTLRNYIDCKNVPSVIMIMKLAKYFNVTLDCITANDKNYIEYSNQTVTELGTLIKNFTVFLEQDKASDDIVTLKIKDRIITKILKEMYFTKNSDNFDSVVQKLSKYYGNMMVYNNCLVDYDTFQNLIHHDYVYHDVEYEMECINENGNTCFGVDPYTFEKIEQREAEWENMTSDERERWWRYYSENKE